MGARSTSEAPMAAFILSIIAGALLLAGSGMMTSMQAYFPFYGGMMGNYFGGYYGMMGPYYGGTGGLGGLFYLATALGLVSGAIVLVGATMLYSRPERTFTWGLVILVFSIVGLVGLGGFFVGSVLGVIGGALAMTSGKERAGQPVTS